MQELLKRSQWKAQPEGFSHRVFLPSNPLIAEELTALWRKYRDELAEFSELYARKRKESTDAGFAATFGDVEGELLYMLLRELKPELVFEISPNTGSSSNYILAAVTRNGNGRVEGFDIEPSFNGVPTRDVIAGNQIKLCDISRYTLHVGDARRTVAERLKSVTPNFCLIDSWHEDVFADFYVHELLPKVKGTVLVQDTAHFDPRPEWATEAYYLLTHLQMTGSEMVPIAAYEDLLNASGVRNGLTPRRPKRSNSIVVHLGEQPAPALAAPKERYWSAWRGHVDEARPAICDLLSMWFGRAGVSQRMAEQLGTSFQHFDPCQQVLAFELLARSDHKAIASSLQPKIDLTQVKGSELPLFLARGAACLEQFEIVKTMAARVRDAASDRSIPTGYRQLLELSDLLYGCGLRDHAEAAFEAALGTIEVTRYNSRKIGVEFASFCLKHPNHFSQLGRVGIGGRQAVQATAIAGKAMLRSAAARAVRRLKA